MNENAQEKIALPQARANRPVTLTYRLEYATMRAIFFLLRRLGLERSSALVGGLLRNLGPNIRSSISSPAMKAKSASQSISRQRRKPMRKPASPAFSSPAISPTGRRWRLR